MTRDQSVSIDFSIDKTDAYVVNEKGDRVLYEGHHFFVFSTGGVAKDIRIEAHAY